MDKKMKLDLSKRYIYYGAVLIILVVICAIGMTGLVKEKLYQQTKYESVLPGKASERASDKIRVLIKTNGFEQIVHNEVIVSFKEGETETITPEDFRFENGTIKLQPSSSTEKITIDSLKRGYGTPSYRGTLELFKTAEGIVIVNELKVEEYLYAVVPSEMPASYELEALKAQAVCARSYAYNQSRAYAYPEYQAHVDDSTAFQVYGNSKEQESAILAVDETYGEKVWYNEHVATTYYYSTSCGRTTNIEAWGKSLNEDNGYLQSIELIDDKSKPYEKDLPWYRWTASIPKETIQQLIELNTGIELGELQNIAVTERGAGQIAQTLTIIGSENTVVIETENKIRSALGGSGYQIEKQDGTIINSSKLLPSAFFTITLKEDNYNINGGGYGHGIGMSQNGANEMAKAGRNYIEILKTFYVGVDVK